MFGWLGWSSVRCLVGGDSLRRLIAGLLVCLTVCLSSCSPAMAASTTDSQLDFDNDIMPLAVASDYTVSFAPATYSLSADSFTYNGGKAVSGAVSSATSGFAFSFGNDTFDGANPFSGFRLYFSNMSNSSNGRSWSIYLNSLMYRCYFSFPVPIGLRYPALDFSTSQVVRSFANLNWSGTGKYTPSNGSAPSFVSGSGSTSVPVSFSVSNTHFNPSDYTYPNRPVSDLQIDVTFDLPDTFVRNGTTYEVTSSQVDSMEICIAFDLRPDSFWTDMEYTLVDYGVSSLSTAIEWAPQPAFLFADGRNMINVLSLPTSSSPSSGLSGVQQSIGTLSQNVTKQISQLKMTMQQGANELKNEIKSQTQTITDKLTAVKDDIVAGITDLKETTTQGFKDVVQGITDLPGKIGEMLQGLIVPDSEKVSGKFEDFNNLAEEKLGVIYQVPEMVISMGQSVVSGAVEQKGEMTLPKFEIIMPATNQSRAGERLTVWEEYTFLIWPEGTEVIHTAVQTATSLVCVIAMINSIKRKYEEWLDGK